MPVYRGAVDFWYFDACVLILAVALLVFRPETLYQDRILFWPAIAYSAFFTISLSQTSIIYLSLLDLWKTSAIFIIYWATLAACRHKSDAVKFSWGLAVLGASLSFYGILQYLGVFSHNWWLHASFLSSTYFNHNHFAAFISMLLPLSLGIVIAEQNTPKKVLLIFLSLIMGLAAVMALSRGGLVSLGVGLLVFCMMLIIRKTVLGRTWGLWAVATLLILAAIIVSIAPTVLYRLRSVASFDAEENFIARVYMWKGALRLIAEKPLFGTGPGTFGYAFLHVRPAGFYDRPLFAHNDILQLVSDCGLFVFISAVIFWIIVFRRGFQIIHQDAHPTTTGLGIGALSGLVSMLVHGMVDFNFHIPANWAIASVLTAILFSLDRTSQPTADIPVKGLKKIGLFFLIIFCLTGIYFGAPDFWQWQSERSALNSNYKDAMLYLNRSVQWGPLNAEAYYERGLLKERLKSSVPLEDVLFDFNQAMLHNGLEPYYDYHALKNDITRKHVFTRDQLTRYYSMLKKDSNDPKLNFLAGRALLTASRWDQNEKIEPLALQALRQAIHLDPRYAYSVYEWLWYHYKKSGPIEKFYKEAPIAAEAFLEFLNRHDLLDLYIYYFDEINGLKPTHPYDLNTAVKWRKETRFFTLSDFINPRPDPVHNENSFYRNGLIQKNIQFKGGLVRLVFKGRGTASRRIYPLIAVKIDQKPVDLVYLNSPHETLFYSVFMAPSGDHWLGFEFINDAVDSARNTDRNIWVSQVQISEVLDA